MKKKAVKLCLTLLIVGTTVSTISAFAGEQKLNLDVVDYSSNWTTKTPMYLKTTDTENRVYAEINAINIGDGTTKVPLP